MSYPVSTDTLLLSGRLSMEYLLENIRSDGSFAYKQNASSGEISSEYNILRHAGSLYALYRYVDVGQRPHFSAQLHLGQEYLRQNCVTVPSNRDLYCIVGRKIAKLGGSALALLVFVEEYKRRPEPGLLTIMRGLATFLVWMMEPSGKFKSKLRIDTLEFFDFDSVYYPGQAILALVRLYAIDPDPNWLTALITATDYQVDHPVRDKRFVRGHNHWFATALPEVYNLVPSQKYLDECWLIASSTASALLAPLETVYLSVTALATRGEALISAIKFMHTLDKSGYLKEVDRHQLDQWTALCDDILAFCLSHQVNQLQPGQPRRMLGGILNNQKDPFIRIDYVQHVLHLLMGRLEVDQ